MWRAARSLGLRAGIDLDRFPTFLTRRGLLARVIRELEVSHVVDVGANAGQFGSELRAIGYRGPIAAFEPVPEAFSRLEQVAHRSPPWTATRVAIGATAHRATLQVATATEVSSFLPVTERFAAFDHTRTTETIEVDVRPLDEVYAPSQPARILLKSDTQGYDLEVLAGGPHVLSAAVAVHIELAVRPNYVGAPSWTEVLAVLEREGFVLAGLFPVDVDERLRLVELDGIFVRAS